MVGDIEIIERAGNVGMRANWLCACRCDQECGQVLHATSFDLVRWGDDASHESRTAFHRVSIVDAEALLGECSICGPGSAVYFHPSMNLWICRAARQDARMRSDHGISTAQWQQRFEEQGCRCAICGTTEAAGNGWATDHDRTCCPGARSCEDCFRGILCPQCNVGIGMFKDDAARLTAAIEYLRGSGDRRATCPGVAESARQSPARKLDAGNPFAA